MNIFTGATDVPYPGVEGATSREVPSVVIMVQNRSRLFLDAFARLLENEPGVSVPVRVESGADLVERAAQAPADVIFFELPSDPPDLVVRLGKLPRHSSSMRLVGIGPRSQREQLSTSILGPLPRTTAFSDLLRAAGVDESARSLDQRLPALAGVVGGPLTEREMRTLALLSSGQTTNEIADRLQLSRRAVRSSRENLLTKLDAQSSAEAVATGIRLGFLATSAQE